MEDRPASGSLWPERYEQVAEQIFFPIYPYLLKDLLNVLHRNSLKGLKVIDIGAGSGEMLNVLSSAHPETLVGTDISQQILATAVARTTLNHASILCCGDVHRLPFKDASFDIAFSRGSVMFWSDLQAGLQEVARILKPTGTAWMGGGYGISTPQEIRVGIKKKRELREDAGEPRKGFPKMEFDQLESLAQSVGGRTVLYPGKPGFWLFWQSHL